MTAVYPTRHLYIDTDNDGIPEDDIADRVVSSIDFESGIKSYKDTDRLSQVGTLSVTLRNDDGALDVTQMIGKKISATLTLGTREKQVWHGVVAPESDIDSGEWGPRRITLKARDWMNTANRSRVGNIELARFMTADEALPALLDATHNPPVNTSFENGFERFPNMYDGALKSTVVYSELDKITKSELGYLYLTFRDNAYGETLRFEDYLHRGSTHPLSRVPSDVVTPSLLKYHGNAGASGYLKFHGNAGASGRIKLAQAQAAYFDRLMGESDWEAGRNVVNQMSVNNIPRKTDSSLVVLYSIASPISIGTGKRITIDGTYSDPNGGTLIQATDVVLALSDYAFNSNADGSGTDLKANLTVIFVKGVNGFTVRATNFGPAGFLTSLQVRGKGTYKYSRVETLRENTESQTDLVRNIISDSITREYSNNYDVSKNFADMVLAQDRAPRKVMKTVSFVGNTSEHLMLAFMYLEQGDKVQIVESAPSHTGDYYIQAVKGTITTGGIVYYTWHLKEEIETICTPIAVTTPAGGTPKMVAVDFGILPYLANLPKFSYSFWFRRNDAACGFEIISRSVDIGTGRRGFEILTLNDGKIYFKSFKTPTDGVWVTTNGEISVQDVWYHVCITYDNTSDLADPAIYINGSAVAVTENGAPSGSTDDDSDCPLILFNTGPVPTVIPNREYAEETEGMSLKDVRIYNRILTAAEVTEMAGNEDDYSTVPDGLLFQGIFAPTDNIADYVGDTIGNDDLVLEAAHGAAGVPYNEDTSSAATMLTGEAI